MYSHFEETQLRKKWYKVQELIEVFEDMARENQTMLVYLHQYQQQLDYTIAKFDALKPCSDSLYESLFYDD